MRVQLSFARLLRTLGLVLLGAVLAALTAYAVYLHRLPPLSIWHTAQLDAEFTAADAAKVSTLSDYRAVEERVFAQLAQRVYDQVPERERLRYMRYTAGSPADPRAYPPDWNRTFELAAPSPKGVVLLLHGLSDGPYSLRALGEHLHALGHHVVGLRLPGHGAAPSGLAFVRPDDMAAAVRIAMRDLASRFPGVPIVVVGYSTGAALAVDYALARLQGERLPPMAKLVLISPAIGVSPAARYAVWQGRIAVLVGAPKVAWTDVQPEFDPYKFASFTVNAADLVYQLTARIGERLDALGRSGPVAGLPPILSFSSVADATVSTPAVVKTLFARLAPGGHRLVLFDVNRHADAATFVKPEVLVVHPQLLEGPPLPFDLTVVSNADRHSLAMASYTRSMGGREIHKQLLDVAWPAHVFSLSHVALPFPPDDPVYGAVVPAGSTQIFLGRPSAQGERGLLAFPETMMVRLRHNPFFGPMARSIEEFLAAS
jgi:alpha-beta hydrolase superfamily lysophospholipase